MPEDSAPPRDLTHLMLSVLFIGVLIAGSFWVVRPFLMPLLWAAVIVVATWPLFERIEARLGGRHGLAVAVMSAAILLVIIVPIALAVVTIAGRFGDLTAKVGALSTLTVPAPPEWVGRIPLAGDKIAAGWQEFAALGPDERTAALAPHAKRAAGWFVAKAGGFGVTMLTFLLTVIIATILYANGATVRRGIFAFARRLAGQRGEDAATLAGRAIRGVVLGVVVTALIQAGLSGVGLVLVGIPAAGLLVAVMLMLCLAQLGPLLIMLPAVAWVYWSGRPVAGTVLLVIAVVAGTLDNVVRPILIKRGADLPLLLIFAGVIGGLVAFGVIGLFVGPMVLAVTYTLLAEWVAGTPPQQAAEASGG